jgi:lambda family phage portal protein
VNLVDRIVGYLSPASGYWRLKAREEFEKLAHRQNPARVNRTNVGGMAHPSSGDLPTADVAATRDSAWKLFDENPHAKKIVRTLTAQVFGRGLMPKSEATKNDAAWGEFRKAAKKLWKDWVSTWDYTERKDGGGLGYVGMAQQWMQELVVGGEFFIIKRRLTQRQMKRRGSPIPLAIELLGSDWLVDDTVPQASSKLGDGAFIWHGIEYDREYRRVAYHFRKVHPQDQRWAIDTLETVRVPAEDVIHVYNGRAKQQRGRTWFYAALIRLKNIDDYDLNELMASATAAMPTFVTKTETPNAVLGGITSVSDDTDDAAGNRTTNMQAATMVQLRVGEEFQGFAPGRPNPAAEKFGTYTLRGIAAAFPGVKPSTVHGDYRGSSFASERSADNDAWRETDGTQAWIVETLLQPLWRECIEAGVLSGWFAEQMDARSFSPAYYDAHRSELDCASWTGPVAKAVNPLQDANAVATEIHTGVLPYPEAVAQAGGDFEENLQAIEETWKAIDALDVPPSVKVALQNQFCGVMATQSKEAYQQALIDAGEAPSAQEMMDHETELAESAPAQEAPAKKGKANVA